MNMEFSKFFPIFVVLAVVACGTVLPASAAVLQCDESTGVRFVEGMVPANVGVTLLNGLLWLGGREQTWTGGIGIGIGVATLLVSAWTLFSQQDHDEREIALTGLGIGAMTTTLGVVNVRHAERNRRQRDGHAPSFVPSVFTDVRGHVATGVVINIEF